jgi:GNAT superfamily N-acetyltransferase
LECRTVIIRQANGSDFDALLEMGEQFYNQTHYSDFCAYDFGSAAVLFDIMLRDGVFLVAEQDGDVIGMVGLVVVPFMFNPSKRSAHEVVWYVDPSARAARAGPALMAAVEPACRALNVDVIHMLHLSSSPSGAARMYERLGLKRTETTYSKVL